MINLTEYSNTSPASAAETVPEERSTTGAPASAASSTELITTDEEAEYLESQAELHYGV